jgi:hypothetical protein
MKFVPSDPFASSLTKILSYVHFAVRMNWMTRKKAPDLLRESMSRSVSRAPLFHNVVAYHCLLVTSLVKYQVPSPASEGLWDIVAVHMCTSVNCSFYKRRQHTWPQSL